MQRSKEPHVREYRHTCKSCGTEWIKPWSPGTGINPPCPQCQSFNIVSKPMHTMEVSPERKELRTERDRYRDALTRIANLDTPSSKMVASNIARNALKGESGNDDEDPGTVKQTLEQVKEGRDRLQILLCAYTCNCGHSNDATLSIHPPTCLYRKHVEMNIDMVKAGD